jgi:CRP-like cAMP-binding protein
MKDKSSSRYLKDAAVFSVLSEKELSTVLRTAKERSFDSQSKIVEEGSVGTGFYLILEGQVEVHHSGRVLARLGKGQFFGELALLCGDVPRSADVVALQETRCLVLARWDLLALIKTHPEVGLKMLAELARRLQETNQALSE